MSNETKWTPGPWNADPLGVVVGGKAQLTSICTIPIQQWANSIFHVTTEKDYKQETVEWLNACLAESQANARLIAAAPEMAALLERMTNAAERRLRELRALNSIDALQLTNDIADARALLAKIKKGE